MTATMFLKIENRNKTKIIADTWLIPFSPKILAVRPLSALTFSALFDSHDFLWFPILNQFQDEVRSVNKIEILLRLFWPYGWLYDCYDFPEHFPPQFFTSNFFSNYKRSTYHPSRSRYIFNSYSSSIRIVCRSVAVRIKPFLNWNCSYHHSV